MLWQEYYVDPLIFTHDEGHSFPTQPPRAREIYDRIAAEIWRRSGTLRKVWGSDQVFTESVSSLYHGCTSSC